MLEITLQGEQITLLPQRAMYYPKQKAIIIADVHWGKAGHFRKNGIAMPVDTHDEDAQNLSHLINQHQPERLIVAGDLFHSKHNKEVNSFAHWRQQYTTLSVELITGNHDILPKDIYQALGITPIGEALTLAPFTIVHDMPTKPTNSYYIHGHIHPAINVSKGRMGMRLDCFCQDDNRFILPAFGRFTGRHKLKASEHKRLYVIAEKEIIRWQ